MTRFSEPAANRMITKKQYIIIGIVSIVLWLCCLGLGYSRLSAHAAGKTFANDYGVFLSVNADSKAVSKFKGYKTIIIDVQNGFTKKEITKLKRQGHIVYSYINVGALENYRDYYAEYDDVTLDVYENWPDEKWVDVSKSKWQNFILNDLADEIIKTGVDGFFVDNADVYYKYHKAGIYKGLQKILKGLKKKGKVIINGGDTFVTEYYKKNKNLNGILDGVNQESVFSRIIDYDKNKFGKSKASDRKYFQEYLSLVSKAGKKCYVIEYTKDKKLTKQIRKYCKNKGYKYYISKKLDLS